MISKSERFKIYERDAAVLESISKQYSEDSTESKVVKSAAFALFFALTEKYEEFSSFVRDLQKELSPEEKKRLLELGLHSGE